MAIYGKRASPRKNHPDLFDWYRERELRRTNHAARQRNGRTLAPQ
jgi:hypothetical protein